MKQVDSKIVFKLQILSDKGDWSKTENATLFKFPARRHFGFFDVIALPNIVSHRRTSGADPGFQKGGGRLDGRPYLLRGGRENALTKKNRKQFYLYLFTPCFLISKYSPDVVQL